MYQNQEIYLIANQEIYQIYLIRIKHLKDILKLKSYPNTTLIKKPSHRTEPQFKGFAIISYYPGSTEKIQLCLS